MKTKATLFIVMYLFVFSGCSTNSPQYQLMGEDPIILVHDREHGGMEMHVSGTLEHDSNSKCIFLKLDHDESVTLPIWPKGTVPKIENDLRGIHVPGVGTILEGDKIDTGGGFIDPSHIEHLDVPGECIDDVGAVQLNAWWEY